MSSHVSHLTSAPLPDVCRNKHGGQDTSEEANARIHSRKEIDRARILKLRDARGQHGLTLHEVMGALGMKAQTASARLAELKADEELEQRNKDRRDGCAVLVQPKKGQLSLLEAK